MLHLCIWTCLSRVPFSSKLIWQMLHWCSLSFSGTHSMWILRLLFWKDKKSFQISLLTKSLLTNAALMLFELFMDTFNLEYCAGKMNIQQNHIWLFYCVHGPFECVVEDENWIQKLFHKLDISEIQHLDEFCLCDTADYALLQIICRNSHRWKVYFHCELYWHAY